MPAPGVPLERQGFLTLGTYDGADPAPGHEYLLREIVLGEELGFDSVWLRHRHFQSGISSPVAILAAASQRTSRTCGWPTRPSCSECSAVAGVCRSSTAGAARFAAGEGRHGRF